MGCIAILDVILIAYGVVELFGRGNTNRGESING